MELIASPTLALDTGLSRLLAAAGSRAGLNLLLLFGHDPMTLDTAEGFASRVQFPVAEVSDALAGLQQIGVVQSCRRDGRTSKHVSYWLSEDAKVYETIRELGLLYLSGPAARHALLAALPV
jgi:hypothetical protein